MGCFDISAEEHAAMRDDLFRIAGWEGEGMDEDAEIDAKLAQLREDCWRDLKAALPRSEMGRALMAELAAEDARERSMRRCSDCVHWSIYGGEFLEDPPEFMCDKGRYEGIGGAYGKGEEAAVPVVEERNALGVWNPTLRACLRTAATCDDFEAVDE